MLGTYKENAPVSVNEECVFVQAIKRGYRYGCVYVVVVSTPPPVRLGRAAPLKVDSAPTTAWQTSGKRGPSAPPGPPKEISMFVKCVCAGMLRDGSYYVCVHYRVDTLVLDVCLVKFCEDMASVVGICLLLVVQEFLCT